MPELNQRTVDAARPGGGERFVWDDELRGFGLRVFPSSRKTFFVEYRDRVHQRTRRYVLGTYGVLAPAEACPWRWRRWPTSRRAGTHPIPGAPRCRTGDDG
jgi:hypothetical protein